jgi:hypothetical protein
MTKCRSNPCPLPRLCQPGTLRQRVSPPPPRATTETARHCVLPTLPFARLTRAVGGRAWATRSLLGAGAPIVGSVQRCSEGYDRAGSSATQLLPALRWPAVAPSRFRVSTDTMLRSLGWGGRREDRQRGQAWGATSVSLNAQQGPLAIRARPSPSHAGTIPLTRDVKGGRAMNWARSWRLPPYEESLELICA